MIPSCLQINLHQTVAYFFPLLCMTPSEQTCDLFWVVTCQLRTTAGEDTGNLCQRGNWWHNEFHDESGDLCAERFGTFARALDCSSSVRQPSLHMSAAAILTRHHSWYPSHQHHLSRSIYPLEMLKNLVNSLPLCLSRSLKFHARGHPAPARLWPLQCFERARSSGRASAMPGWDGGVELIRGKPVWGGAGESTAKTSMISGKTLWVCTENRGGGIIDLIHSDSFSNASNTIRDARYYRTDIGIGR